MTTSTRLLLLLPLALVAALALAACGGSGGNGSPKASSEDKAYEGALKFAKCMRDHGVDMADPQRSAGGGILLRAGKKGGGPEKGSGPIRDDPKDKAAQQACGKYLQAGGGKAPSPAEQAKQRDAFVGYARCMRGKGINMPDPQFEGNGIKMALGRGTNPESARFKAADRACHPILAAVEPKGAGGPTSVKGGAQ